MSRRPIPGGSRAHRCSFAAAGNVSSSRGTELWILGVEGLGLLKGIIRVPLRDLKGLGFIGIVGFGVYRNYRVQVLGL